MPFLKWLGLIQSGEEQPPWTWERFPTDSPRTSPSPLSLRGPLSASPHCRVWTCRSPYYVGQFLTVNLVLYIHSSYWSVSLENPDSHAAFSPHLQWMGRLHGGASARWAMCDLHPTVLAILHSKTHLTTWPPVVPGAGGPHLSWRRTRWGSWLF